MDKPEALEQARRNLADYLRVNSLRNTPERNALLEAIYQSDAPVRAEDLSVEMSKAKRGRLRISRATVYNNLRLFEDAGLVRKLFQEDKVFFERTDKSYGIIRLVCGGCGRITEVNNDKVRRLINTMRTRRFTVTNWVLNMNGLCSRCTAELKKKQNRLNKKIKTRNENRKD